MTPAPRRLDRAYTLGRYWNYLRRQLYVMDTYACAAAARTNHTMLALHSYLSWAFVAPALLAGLRGAAQAAALLQVSQRVSMSNSAIDIATRVFGRWRDRNVLHTLLQVQRLKHACCAWRGLLVGQHVAALLSKGLTQRRHPHGYTHLQCIGANAGMHLAGLRAPSCPVC
jgi:hypothetical protein